MISWIKKKLKKLTNSLRPYKNSSKSATKSEIPNHIADIEKIVRVLLFPTQFRKSDEILKWQAFRTKAGEDEVSVIRLDYCDENFCKKHGKSIQDPNRKASYYGLGVLFASEIRDLEADVIYTPKHHDFHADIKVGYVPTKGEAIPPEIKYKMEEMASKARIYKDSSPDTDLWIDPPIELQK
ncbi:MAG: hypothetical protein WD048_15960 [Chitinophagales bacterium]